MSVSRNWSERHIIELIKKNSGGGLVGKQVRPLIHPGITNTTIPPSSVDFARTLTATCTSDNGQEFFTFDNYFSINPLGYGCCVPNTIAFMGLNFSSNNVFVKDPLDLMGFFNTGTSTNVKIKCSVTVDGKVLAKPAYLQATTTLSTLAVAFTANSPAPVKSAYGYTNGNYGTYNPGDAFIVCFSGPAPAGAATAGLVEYRWKS